MTTIILLLLISLTPALTAVENDSLIEDGYLFKWCIYETEDDIYEQLVEIDERCPAIYVSE
jgi:hypothetical protein